MKLLSIAMKPLASPPFPPERLEEMARLMGGATAAWRPAVMSPINLIFVYLKKINAKKYGAQAQLCAFWFAPMRKR